MLLEKFRNGSAIDHTHLSGTITRIHIPMSSATSKGSNTVKLSQGTETNERLADSVATVSSLGPYLTEVPRINEAMRANQNYEYIYGWYSTRHSNAPNSIGKFNVKDGSAMYWTNAEDEFGVFMGEPIFVSSPDSVHEDDGIVLATGLELATSNCFVVAIDARSMQEIGRLISTNTSVNFGFHTIYVPR